MSSLKNYLFGSWCLRGNVNEFKKLSNLIFSYSYTDMSHLEAQTRMRSSRDGIFLLHFNEDSCFNAQLMNTNSKRTRVTSCDIACSAGVSQATVSRVLTGRPVSQELRDKVKAAIRELKYRPNGTARAMRTSHTGNIGLVVPRLTNPLHAVLVHVLGGTISRAGFRLVVWSTDEMDEKAAADAVRESLVDGVIMTAATTAATPLYEAVQVNAPVVLANRIIEEWPCDQVASNNVAGARMVAKYLLSSGRRRIGMVGGISLASSICQRQAGFREMLEAQRRPLEERLCERVDQFSYSTGFKAAARLLDLAEPPDALFCVNDVLALGARDAARQRGLVVPKDLWIIGYDDMEMASWHAFDLTTVRQPFLQMAELAVRFLRERISGYKGDARYILLPNHLVLRGSTARWQNTSTHIDPDPIPTADHENE